jgi:alpha-ribazole phosphatase
MTKLLLIRHGQTEWNVECRWQGQTDVPLNLKGIEQAAQLAQRLQSSGLDAIYSSDLCRALQTAQILAETVELPVIVDARLREVYQGEWEGMLVSEIEQRDPAKFQLRFENPLAFTTPGGETTLQVQERVLSAVQEILAKHSGETVAIVSHGFVIALLLVNYRDIPIEKVWGLIPQNGEVQELEVVDSL